MEVDEQPVPPFKKLKQDQPKEGSGIVLDDLPDLALELVLSHLPLGDRIRSRAVSRRWKEIISGFKPTTLCYSEHPNDFIFRKSQLASGVFARNFVDSFRFRFNKFFQTFAQSTLVKLQHLRLCDLELNKEEAITFTRTLNSFRQLKSLDLFRIGFLDEYDPAGDRRLNLPLLNSIQLVGVREMAKLTLNTPNLRNIKLSGCFEGLAVELVDSKSVERLVIDCIGCIDMKRLKSLKYCYIRDNQRDKYESDLDPNLLESLKQLTEVHVAHVCDAKELFTQKQQHKCVDLAIYLCGLFLYGPEDQAIGSLSYRREEEILRCLAKNLSRLADELPLWSSIDYPAIELMPCRSEAEVLRKLSDLYEITVTEPILNVDRFLGVLKQVGNIAKLNFERDLPQALFNQLPEHCTTVQKLSVYIPPSDLQFLFRLKNLTALHLYDSIDIGLVQKILEELPFLSHFVFYYLDSKVIVEIEHRPKMYAVVLEDELAEEEELEDAIEFIEEFAEQHEETVVQ